MRKIEQQMNAAIKAKRDWEGENTSVKFTDVFRTGQAPAQVSEIYLHGNHIADFWHDAEKPHAVPILRTLAQWPTRTTVSRLRALGLDVCLKKGVPYYKGQKVV